MKKGNGNNIWKWTNFVIAWISDFVLTVLFSSLAKQNCVCLCSNYILGGEEAYTNLTCLSLFDYLHLLETRHWTICSCELGSIVAYKYEDWNSDRLL